MMTNYKTEQAKEVLYAYMDVERDLSQPKIIIHTLKELIYQLGKFVEDADGFGDTIVRVRDILALCEELEKL